MSSEIEPSQEVTKDRQIRRRVAIGTASNVIGQVVVFIVSFLLTPFMLHQLGPTVYGLWVLVGSMVAYGAILDFGIWGTIVKYVAQYHAQGDALHARRFLRSIRAFYLIICVLLVGGGAAIAPFFADLFQLPAEQHGLARTLVIMMSLATGLALPGMLPLAVLRGLQRYDLVNVIDIVTSLATAAATVVALLLGGGALGVAGANLGGVFILFILGSIAVRRIAPELDLTRRTADDGVHPLRDRQSLNLAFSHSWPLFAQDIATRLQTRTDEITIGLFLPVRLVGSYNIARRLGETTQTLTRQFMKTLLPLASQLHAEQDEGRLRVVYLVGMRLTVAITAVLGILLIVLAGPVLTLWVGAEYAAYTGIVTILTLAQMIVTVRWAAVAILQAMARHRILAVSSLSAGVANLALSLLLVRPLGLTGVALGTLIPAAVEACFVILPYSLRVTGVDVREAWREIVVPALLPVLPMLAGLYALHVALVPDSILTILIVAAVGALLYLLGYLALARGIERHWIAELFAYLRRVDVPGAHRS